MKLTHIIALSAFSLLACDASDATSRPDPLIGVCDADPCDPGATLTLTLDHADGISWEDGRSVRVTLFGYDRLLADAAATPIAVFDSTVLEIPTVIALELPDQPHSLIDQGHGPVSEGDAGFYLSFGRDLGCEFLVQDFNQASIEFFEQTIPSAASVFVTDVCR